jgi:peptidylprolyl isomerase
MEVSHTKRSTRIIIWVIAIVMAAGFLGSYFLIILENNNQANKSNNAQTAQSQSSNLSTDPTAYKVSGQVTTLQTTDETVGTGTEVKPGDTVRVNYKLTNAQSGIKYDSSYDRGQPATLSLGQVIPAWQEGIPGMKVGGKRRLIVPASLAYGAEGSGNIPANADLVFEVELLTVNPPDAQTAQ